MERTFGQNLRALRTERGLSQEELAAQLGTTKQVVSRYENGQRTPKVTVVEAFARRLGVPLAALLGEAAAQSGALFLRAAGRTGGRMTHTLNIALLQLAPCGTLQEKLRKGAAAFSRARALGADLALFPEMWSNGYAITARPAARWLAQAVPAGGPFVQSFAALAGQLQMAIAVTFLEQCAHCLLYTSPSPRD